jgi:hypothetical protein
MATATLTQNAVLHHHPLSGVAGGTTPHNAIPIRYPFESGPFSSPSSHPKSDSVPPLIRTIFGKPSPKSSRRHSNRMARTRLNLGPPAPCQWEQKQLDELNAVFHSDRFLETFPTQEHIRHVPVETQECRRPPSPFVCTTDLVFSHREDSDCLRRHQWVPRNNYAFLLRSRPRRSTVSFPAL